MILNICTMYLKNTKKNEKLLENIEIRILMNLLYAF